MFEIFRVPWICLELLLLCYHQPSTQALPATLFYASSCYHMHNTAATRYAFTMSRCRFSSTLSVVVSLSHKYCSVTFYVMSYDHSSSPHPWWAKIRRTKRKSLKFLYWYAGIREQWNWPCLLSDSGRFIHACRFLHHLLSHILSAVQ